MEQIPTTVDLFTFQECALETYETDLDFLTTHIHCFVTKRARIAMVTAWKTERFELLADYHLNRTLVSVLRESTGALDLLCIAICHCRQTPQRAFSTDLQSDAASGKS